jgi:hypothetical protein
MTYEAAEHFLRGREKTICQFTNSDANPVIKSLKHLSGIHKAVNVRNAPDAGALTWSVFSLSVPAAAVKPKRSVQTVSRGRQDLAEPDRSAAGCHGFRGLRLTLFLKMIKISVCCFCNLASFNVKLSEKEHVNELGSDSHLGSGCGLGGLEPLGITQTWNSDLNVRFMWDWKSHEKGSEFLNRFGPTPNPCMAALLAASMQVPPLWSRVTFTRGGQADLLCCCHGTFGGNLADQLNIH